MRFFCFTQNNSGGVFISDGDVAEFVVVEAADAADANRRAQAVGVYFDGVRDGRDCECCGDRFFPVFDGSRGDEVPSVFGEPVESFKPFYGSQRVVVHFASGEKKVFDCA